MRRGWTITTTMMLSAVLWAPSASAGLLGGLDDAAWADTLVATLSAPIAALEEPEHYDDPLHLDWSAYLPAYPMGDYTPPAEQECTRGQIQCVDKVIRTMTRRYNSSQCDHNAVFMLQYLVTTQEYRRAVTTPGFFDDPEFLNHYDVVFADFYDRAWEAWTSGDVAATPPAWRLAFNAADERQLTGMGDVLMGMNAHIRRDLPFVLEAIGLVAPDGTSRKADHTAVNTFLNEVGTQDAAERHDPTVDDGDVAFTSIDNHAAIQLIIEWREEAWRKAEMLTNASSPAERDDIARWIESEAAASALLISTAFASSDSTGRDTWCTTNWTDWA